MMSVDGFWTSPDRFTVLGDVEYRERVENGTRTARRLFEKFEGEQAASFNRRLTGQVALQLWLLEQACASLDARDPWETYICLDIRTGPEAHTAADRLWLARLRGMYQEWAASRRMQIQVLQKGEMKGRDFRPEILAVSGYAAYSILKNESGLHVWEEPSNRMDKHVEHRQVLVQVVPQPDEAGEQTLSRAHQALQGVSGQTPGIVRNYREEPDPLVRDRTCGWRTGKLDLVLAGNFDLLGATAESSPARKGAG
jgi:ATP-dependent Clp protease ATP-binding subunit ClpC